MPAAHQISCTLLTIPSLAQTCARLAFSDYISAIHNSTHVALFHLVCSLLSNLSPCTAPSTVKTLCDSSIRCRLSTTIPANSNQSLRHIPYASACSAVSSSMYLYYAITRSTKFLTTCRETRRGQIQYLALEVECCDSKHCQSQGNSTIRPRPTRSVGPAKVNNRNIHH